MATPSARKPPKTALAFPIVDQKTSYSCGPAALLSVLRFFGRFSGSEKALYRVLRTTPKDGTHPLRMVEGARAYGFEARVEENMSVEKLERYFDQGQALILNVQAWKTSKGKKYQDEWEAGHYLVLMGVDATHYYFMDSYLESGRYGYLAKSELPARWHDYENEKSGVRKYYRTAIVLTPDAAWPQRPGPSKSADPID